MLLIVTACIETFCLYQNKFKSFNVVKNPIIHIVSCSPRSGTTLFHEMMVNCFDVELSYLSEKSVFRTDFIKGGLTVIKDPNEVFYMKCMLAIEPRLHVLYLSRDPRDVVTSIHRGGGEGSYCTGINRWIEYQQEFDKIKGHPRVLEVKYEDLVSSCDEIQNQLLKKFDFLVKKKSFSSYHEQARPSELSLVAMNGLRPVSTKSLGSWKKHLERIKQQLIKCPELPNILIKYGYESDKEWLGLLDTVSPLPTENDTFLSIYSVKIRYRIFRKCLWYSLSRFFRGAP